jgi:hypothetical protein
MAPSSGFQSNSTIQTAWWIWKPDPSDVISREVMIDTSKIQYIEASSNHNNVWLYFPASDVSTSQRPYALEGEVAQAFLADMEALFS